MSSIHKMSIQFSSVQFLSCVQLFVPLWTVPCQASVSITSSRSLPKLMSIESVMPSNHLILHHPLILLSSIFPIVWVFSNESALCIRWPKYWSFSFSFSPTNEHPGLISFRMDWVDLLVVQGNLKSLLQCHSSFPTLAKYLSGWLLDYMVRVCFVLYMSSLRPHELCSPPDSSVHGIFQARILEWVAISSSRGSSQPRDWIWVSCIGRLILYHPATWEAHV